MRGAQQDTVGPAGRVGRDGRFKLTRQQLPVDTRVLVTWALPADASHDALDDDEAERGPLWMQTLPQFEQAELDAVRYQIRQKVKDPLQQITLDSMSFEQRHLSVNLRWSLSELQAVAAASGRVLPQP